MPVQSIQPNSPRVTPPEDPLHDFAEIDSSIEVFKAEIDKWERRPDETSKKITDFLKSWLSRKEREKFRLKNRLEEHDGKP